MKTEEKILIGWAGTIACVAVLFGIEFGASAFLSVGAVGFAGYLCAQLGNYFP